MTNDLDTPTTDPTPGLLSGPRPETSLIDLDSPSTLTPPSSIPTLSTASTTSTTSTASAPSLASTSTATPSFMPRPSPPKPAGPRGPPTRSGSMLATSPKPLSTPTSPRDAAGSSRTRVYYPPVVTAPFLDSKSSDHIEHIDHAVDVNVDLVGSTDRIEGSDPEPPEYASSKPFEEQVEHLPAYRSPEAVIDVDDQESDHPTSALPPGVLAVEELPKKVTFTESNKYNGGNNAIERPQIGLGSTLLRLLEQIHTHQLYRLDVEAAVRATLSTSLKLSAPRLEPTEEEVQTRTAAIEFSLPGGEEGKSHEWFFCPTCFDWFHVYFGTGRDDKGLPQILSMDEWDLVTTSIKNSGLVKRPISEPSWNDRKEQLNRLNDLLASRAIAQEEFHHFHPFPHLIAPTLEGRIERIDVPGQTDAFTHLDPAWADLAPQIEEKVTEAERPVLWASCSSKVWAVVDTSPLPGQMSGKLVKDFTDSKWGNPPPGADPMTSVVEAWSLVLTLLTNAVFRGNRGWVKLDNSRFAAKIGSSLLSSKLVEQFGFGCKQEDSVLRIGPLSKSDMVSDEDVATMDRYMMRAWVEISLYLEHYHESQGSKQLTEPYAIALEDVVPNLALTPRQSPLSSQAWAAAERMGIGRRDVALTISDAYDLQIAEDQQQMPYLLDALQQLAYQPLPNREIIQFRVATERSLHRYTASDLEKAYHVLGLGKDYLDQIGVGDASDVPDEWVLRYHSEKMGLAGNDSYTRRTLSDALEVVGKARKSDLMVRLGSTGTAYLSVEQAYAEFNAVRNSLEDEMLIMQYETYISDRPSREDHYRMCLQIIADAPGDERPVLQAFLQGKDISELQGPVRKDIPVGLKNIGNTCYLNSILQFIYTIKPIREAVVSFDGGPEPGPEVKPDMVAKIHSSRRFVNLLRELFNNMYATDSTAIAPAEELARLAIVPIDLVEARHDEGRPAPLTLTTIDEIPTVNSPSSTQVATPSPRLSSASPLMFDESREDPGTLASALASAHPAPRGRDGTSVLGKRASQDRESSYGSDGARPRGPQSDLISLDDEGDEEEEEEEDVSMTGGWVLDKSKGEGRQARTPFTPEADLSQLDLSSTTIPTDLLSPPPSPPARVEPTTGDTTTGRDAPVSATYAATAAAAKATVPPPLPPRRQSQALVAAEKFGLQQDAAEILINVLAQLEYALDRPDQEANLIQSLFSCKFRQQIVLAGQAQEPVESVFVHPIIGVEEEGKDLYECLGEIYLGGAEIEYAGQKGYKMDLIDELPPMLYIQMRRSQYDAAKRSQTKTNTHVPFGKSLVMDRFLAGGAKREKSIALTREIMRMRARLQDLKASKPLPITQAFQFTHDALSDLPDLGISDQLLSALRQEGEAAAEEIKKLSENLPERRAELDRLWAEEAEKKGEVEYELVSVFMHGGTGTGGHYWTYQSNLPIGDKFYYYSDETVREVSETDVFSDKSDQGVSPALLCYVRKNRDLVDTLHRVACEPTAEGEGGAGQSGRGGEGGEGAEKVGNEVEMK